MDIHARVSVSYLYPVFIFGRNLMRVQNILGFINAFGFTSNIFHVFFHFRLWSVVCALAGSFAHSTKFFSTRLIRANCCSLYLLSAPYTPHIHIYAFTQYIAHNVYVSLCFVVADDGNGEGFILY